MFTHAGGFVGSLDICLILAFHFDGIYDSAFFADHHILYGLSVALQYGTDSLTQDHSRPESKGNKLALERNVGHKLTTFVQSRIARVPWHCLEILGLRANAYAWKAEGASQMVFERLKRWRAKTLTGSDAFCRGDHTAAEPSSKSASHLAQAPHRKSRPLNLISTVVGMHSFVRKEDLCQCAGPRRTR